MSKNLLHFSACEKKFNIQKSVMSKVSQCRNSVMSKFSHVELHLNLKSFSEQVSDLVLSKTSAPSQDPDSGPTQDSDSVSQNQFCTGLFLIDKSVQFSLVKSSSGTHLDIHSVQNSHCKLSRASFTRIFSL